MVARDMRMKGTTYEQGSEYCQCSSQPARDRPRVHYNEARSEQDPFPDLPLLEPLDEPQLSEIIAAVENMLKTARENGLPGK